MISNMNSPVYTEHWTSLLELEKTASLGSPYSEEDGSSADRTVSRVKVFDVKVRKPAGRKLSLAVAEWEGGVAKDSRKTLECG